MFKKVSKALEVSVDELINMKKLVSIVFILTFFLLIVPSQSYAAWWNPISWFSKENQNEEQKQTEEVTTSELQIQEVNNKSVKEESPVVSETNPQSEVKMIEVLKAEITTLKTSLDSLYKAHNNLVNDHNDLLKHTTDLEKRYSGLQNQPTTNNISPDTLRRISELERKAGLLFDATTESDNTSNNKLNALETNINNICRWMFGSLNCPSLNPDPLFRTIDNRLKKLEGGY